MDNFLSVVYNSLIGVGFILAIISLFISGSSQVIVTITSYSCLLMGLILIISGLIGNLDSKNMSFSDLFTFIKVNIGPFLILVGILGYLLYLTIYYKTRIEEGHVSNNYSIFSILSIFLICIQVSILFMGMDKQIFKEKGMIPILYSTFIYLIGLINLILAMNLGTILKYFSTDG